MFADLRDKRVVVTGASQGIGEGVARAFGEAGCHVVALARGPVTWPEAINSDRLEILRCDIREPAPVALWLAALESNGERVDVLVNNAGDLHKGDLIDCTPEDFDRVFDVNTRATFFLSQLFARHMQRHGGGVILNSASFAATLAAVSYGVYAASKAATVSLTKSMAAEWAPFGIRVNAFSPGVIPTRMTAPALREHETRMLESISLRRAGTVAEVAHVVLFLASTASSYLTGVNIDVSGGKLIVQDPGAAWPRSPDTNQV